jgi:hypothetical protein
MPQTQFRDMSTRWTREILERCTPREMLVLVAAFGAAQIAKRMGYTDIQKFLQEKGQ